MNDPWDDTRTQAGFLYTSTGLRVPVASATPSAIGWPGAEPALAAGVPSVGASYRGIGPKKYQRSDASVRDLVCERLLLDPYLDASRVDVKVTKGAIVLSGTVRSERMREAAMAAAASVAAGAIESRLQVEVATGAPSRLAVKGRRQAARGRRSRTRGGQR
jgi:hypothetical protein